jgi:hypothetical protein
VSVRNACVGGFAENRGCGIERATVCHRADTLARMGAKELPAGATFGSHVERAGGLIREAPEGLGRVAADCCTYEIAKLVVRGASARACTSVLSDR